MHKTVKPRKHSGIVAFISMLKGLALSPVKLALALGGRWRWRKCCVCTTFPIHSRLLCFSDMFAQRKRGRGEMQKEKKKVLGRLLLCRMWRDLPILLCIRGSYLLGNEACFVLRCARLKLDPLPLTWLHNQEQPSRLWLKRFLSCWFLLFFSIYCASMAVVRRLHMPVQGWNKTTKKIMSHLKHAKCFL